MPPKDLVNASNSSTEVPYSQLTLVHSRFMEMYQYIAQGPSVIQIGKSSIVNLKPKSVFQTIFKRNNKKANNSREKVKCIEFLIK